MTRKEYNARYYAEKLAHLHRSRVRRPILTLDDLLAHAVPEPNTGCWLWVGALMGRTPARTVRYGAYGRAYFNGVSCAAHRLAWILAHGEITSGVVICHHCDTPACVNVDHLFAGMQVDNVADAISKGRMPQNVRRAA